jgi:hypothetical protein
MEKRSLSSQIVYAQAMNAYKGGIAPLVFNIDTKSELPFIPILPGQSHCPDRISSER